MKLIKALSLEQRILSLIVVAMLAIAFVVMNVTESVLEDAIVDQTMEKAAILLSSIERDIERNSTDIHTADLSILVDEFYRKESREFGFSIKRIYLYDREGRVLVDTHGDVDRHVDLNSYYRIVLEENVPYLGDEIEYEKDDKTGEVLALADVIVPIHMQNKVVAGLEAELDMKATLLQIQQLDNTYEQRFLLMAALTTLLSVVLNWWLMRRGLINPIKRISTVTERIANGELEARSESFNVREFDSLAEAINQMAGSIQQLFNEQEQSYLQTLQALAKALEAKDAYTASHSGRVAKFSVMLGKRIGLPAEQLKLLKQGALMHDLGKIGISDTVLNKPGRLSDEEYELMKNHPVMTATIMRPLKRFKEFAEIAAWHHERWDGQGYPDGLKGEEIPLLARVVAIADTWDAMTGDRVYREGMTVETAVSILEQEVDSGQWDPSLMVEFIRMIRSEQEVREHVERDIHQRGRE
jgi:HD-GYP domain-containing protein (c-di-GMP phosphodiesterase class II)